MHPFASSFWISKCLTSMKTRNINIFSHNVKKIFGQHFF